MTVNKQQCINIIQTSLLFTDNIFQIYHKGGGDIINGPKNENCTETACIRHDDTLNEIYALCNRSTKNFWLDF